MALSALNKERARRKAAKLENERLVSALKKARDQEEEDKLAKIKLENNLNIYNANRNVFNEKRAYHLAKSYLNKDIDYLMFH